MRLQAFYISAALRDGFLLLFGAAAFLNIGNQAIVRASKNALAAKAADELAAAKARSAANGSQSRSRNSLVFSRRSSLAERLVVETPAEGNLAFPGWSRWDGKTPPLNCSRGLAPTAVGKAEHDRVCART